MEAATLAAPKKTNTIPKIGSAFAGGIFAGIVAGQDGQPDYYLVHATVDFEIDDINWQGAIEAAKTPINSFHDWSLPNRHEARLLAINSPDSFDKGTWYWTATQHAGNDGYAWVQLFDDGNQYADLKSDEYRARAVRRLSIIE